MALKEGHEPETTWVKTWDEARKILEKIHGGNAKVAVYPYCALQMPPFPPGF